MKKISGRTKYLIEESIKHVFAIFLSVIVIGIFSLTFVYADDTDGLVAVFRLDSNVSDSYINSLDGTVSGATAQSAGSCKLGTCYYFDGTSDYINSASSDLLSCGKTDEITYIIWHNLNTDGAEAFPQLLRRRSGTNDLNININNGGGDIIQYIQYTSGGAKTETGTVDVLDGAWHMSAFTYNGTNQTIYIDGTIDQSQTHADDTCIESTQPLRIGLDDGTGQDLKGYVDMVLIYNKTLSTSEINGLYNSGNACDPIISDCFGGASPPVNDTTPPSITNVNQDPANVTVLNALLEGVIVNATITDDVNLNYTYMSFNTTNIEQYVNGVYVSNISRIITPNDSSGSFFRWVLDENLYLSYTSNYLLEDMEDEPHLNSTLTTANQWLKIRFYNVSNSAPLIFSEIMDTNSTSSGVYYYCNSNYTTGNVIASPWCTQFFVQNDDIIHPHLNGIYHRVMPLSINTTTGYLNDVYVTNTSYILKRGSVTGETYFYIANETNSAQYSGNNGVVWSNLVNVTVDAHIHQIHEGEYFNYSVCGVDNSSNVGCSDIYGDIIDFPKLPPIPVSFIVPVAYNNYNNTIVINYTASSSPTGQSITTYKIEYKLNTSSTWTILEDNNYPLLTYTWDISNRANGNYNIRITVNDSLGYTSVTISPPFNIVNEESLNTQLLTSINNNLTNFYNLFDEVMGMIFEILWIGLFLVLAMVFKQPLLLSLSGLGFGLISLRRLVLDTASTDYDIVLGIMTLVLTFVFIIGGAVWFWIKQSKENSAPYGGSILKRIYNR